MLVLSTETVSKTVKKIEELVDLHILLVDSTEQKFESPDLRTASQICELVKERDEIDKKIEKILASSLLYSNE